MLKISIIIPYFQRTSGVLLRAVQSIENQEIPENVEIETIIVDDGSPVPAREELASFSFSGRKTLTIIEQPNAGVGAARNRGLDAVATDSAYIAFLDSDDIWPNDHLLRAVKALESGFDFYFTDNKREGYHLSHCRTECGPKMSALIDSINPDETKIDVPVDFMINMTLTEFPSQASTVVYKKSLSDSTRFNTVLKSAGEDVLFFTGILSLASRIYFDLGSTVTCGKGINMYFSNLGWDSPKFLGIKSDQLLSHLMISRMQRLSDQNKECNRIRINTFKKELAFHIFRTLIKHPFRASAELKRLIHLDKRAACSLPLALWPALKDYRAQKRQGVSTK